MPTSDEIVDEVYRSAVRTLRTQVDGLEVPVPDAAAFRVRARRRGGRRLAAVVVVLALAVVAAVSLVPDRSRTDVAVEPPAPPTQVVTTVPPATEPPGSRSGPHDGLMSLAMTIDAEPATALVDRSTVSVTGRGFRPDETVTILMCASQAAAATTIQEAQGYCDLGLDGRTRANAQAASDGTLHAELTVARTITTMAGTFDCADGDVDPARFAERRDAGGTGLFEPGTWTCALVAVAFEWTPTPDGSSAGTPVDATAFPVSFDPAGPRAVRRDPKPVVVDGCTDVRYSDGTALADDPRYAIRGPEDRTTVANYLSALTDDLDDAPLTAPPCDPRVTYETAADGTFVVAPMTLERFNSLAGNAVIDAP